MRSAVVVAAIAALASAVQADDKRGTYQTSVPYYMPTSSSPSAPSTTHYVTVGGSAGLVYTPEYISANVNDVVVFNFGIHNHTLTQSSFAQPCVKTSGGIDSGFMPTDGSTSPSFMMTVSTTSPLWFYCMQGNHCEQGMVFAVNPPATGDKTFSNYKQNAMSGTTTVVATATTATTVMNGPPPAATSTPYNSGSDGQCNCVCNVDINNGAPNALQGIGEFGGSVGQVTVAWGAGDPPAAPASAPASAPAPASTQAQTQPTETSTNGGQTSPTPYMMGSPMDNAPNSVGGIPNLGQGTVIPLGTNAASTDPSPQATTAPQSDSSSSDSSSSAPNGGFEANGQLGGANGK